MSKQRYVDTKFWTDNYIVEKDPIEKLLYIYLLTNTLTNILGIYEISIRQIAFDTGIDRDMVYKILERFEKDEKVKYSKGYIAIKKFTKYQANNPKINKGIGELLKEVPIELVEWVEIDFDRLDITLDSLYIGLDRTSRDSNYSNLNINLNSNSNSNTNSNVYSPTTFQEIIDYLNQKADKSFQATTKKTKTLIKARLNEGFTVNDFKKVIDNKTNEWKGQISKDGQNMANYLRPETLFGTKFESYLNQQSKQIKSIKQQAEELAERWEREEKEKDN
jgi:uncharacterized phage protein (TIGR02220 family)